MKYLSIALTFITLSLGFQTVVSSAMAENSLAAIQINGNNSAGEDVAAQWVAFMPAAAIVTNAEGYTPKGSNLSGGYLHTEWERPIDFRWNFGDGTGVISTGERTSILHKFPDDGTFTLAVEAWTADGMVGKGQKEIKVRNRAPVDLMLGAVEVDTTLGRYELTVTSTDAANDTVTYDWDFGDGQQLTDGPWKVYHNYLLSGTYPVKVTAKDEDGGKREETLRIVVKGGAESASDTVDALGDDTPTVEGVGTSFKMNITGSVGAKFDGEVRSIAGIHLSPINDGNICRFMFSAWDDARLAHVMAIFDLPGLPEGGGKYTLRRPRVDVHFQPTASVYTGHKKLIMPGGTIASLGLLALPLAGLMDDASIADQVGVRPGPREQRPPQPLPAASPFGLEEHEAFITSGGTVELDFIPHDRATGKVELSLANPDKDSPFPAINMSGSFSLDLRAMQRDGYMRYKGCGPGEFSVRKVTPEKDQQHVIDKPWVRVFFSRDFEAETLDDSTFQLTYPVVGVVEPVPVAARIQRRDSSAILTPDEPLLSGVRYTARIKTGSEGVRGRNGVALNDSDGTSWYKWTFTTGVDLEPGPGDENLNCHVFQTVRDAPLIVGKPAVARVYADWKRHPQVQPDAQVEEIDARVVMLNGANELASTLHRFVHPDLWASRGIKTSKAEHTANVFFTPEESTPSNVRLALKVKKKPGETHQYNYWSRCATPIWKHKPKLTFDFYMLAVNEWEDDEKREPMTPVMVDMVREAEVFLKQTFPLAEVEANFKKIVRHLPGRRLLNPGEPCDNTCASNILAANSAESSGVDLVFGFVPYGGVIKGGETKQEVGPDEPAYVVLGIDGKAEHHDRFVYAIVHEIGHTLWLEHQPFVDEPQRAALLAIRDAAFANDNQPIHWYEGIEGFLIAPDGGSGVNMSSTECKGNGEWLTPIMYPGSIPYRQSFIMRHHYLKVQKELEKRGGVLRGQISG